MRRIITKIPSFDDLNLRSRRGAQELRYRVREAARDVCDTLRDAYPVRQAPYTSCYVDAVKDALIHADEAISDARDYRYADYYRY